MGLSGQVLSVELTQLSSLWRVYTAPTFIQSIFYVSRPSSLHIATTVVQYSGVGYEYSIHEVIERHSHAIVIGRVGELRLSEKHAALGYWQGRYVAIDQDEGAAKLAEISVPTARSLREV